MAPEGPTAGYAPPAERPPLLWYGILVGLFGALSGAALLAARRGGRELPERIGAADLLSVGVASHKLSRVIAKERVMAPLRAPFTEFEEGGGPAEVEERARGTGLRRAVGELLVCPFCLDVWLVAAMSMGLLFAPRLTRFVASVLSAVTVSDFLQIAHRAAEAKGAG